MPVVGAVIQFSPESGPSSPALDFIMNHPQITAGQEQVKGLPIVIESDSRAAEKAIWNELEAQPGFVLGSVVFVDFSDLLESETRTPEVHPDGPAESPSNSKETP